MKLWAVHLGLLAVLALGAVVLPDYHQGIVARAMVLSVFAMGFNLAFGYTGLLSLGHAMFFAAGMYGMGLTIQHLGTPSWAALLGGIAAGAVLSGVVGALALRASGTAFMIVTLMFAQAVHLSIFLFGDITRSDEGFVLQGSARRLFALDLTQADPRYWAAFTLFALVFVATLILARSPFGRTLVAIRENEARAGMLGYDTFALKWRALVISGTISALAGAAYGLFFGYVGAGFASVQYSILPLLWVLLGGAGTVIGPVIGTLFMTYLIDIASGLTSAYMLIAGAVLLALALFAPQGIAGELRRRLWGWLP